jgi:fluoride ion exporter CrcB/FEX
MTPSAITPNQATKILKALAYSFGSGFTGGLILGLTNFLQSGQTVSNHVYTALVVAGVVGGLNTLAVAIKQVFTQGDTQAQR